MKRWSIILLILAVGIAGVFWLGRPEPAFNPTSGQPLSAAALARIRVSGGGNYALAIGPDGSLWSWGQNSSALGQGNVSAPLLKPMRVGTDRDWAEIYAGYSHSLAIKRDGSLWAWGSNPAGVLGDGTNLSQSSPVQVGTDKDWQAAGPGLHHSAGLKKDGSLWTWGANNFGQLGDPKLAGTNELRTPTRLDTETNWQALAVCSLHNVALKKDGTLWTWGDSGRTPAVAMNSPSNHFEPTQMGSETNWVAVAAGYYHAWALKRDGTLWVWGRNSHLLGNFPAGNYHLLRQLGTNTDWAVIEPGAYHGLARRKDGSLWQFGGIIEASELVMDTTGNQRFPGGREHRQISGEWVAVASGANFSLAVARDGALWHWGEIPGAQTRENLLVNLWRKLKSLFGKRATGPQPVFRERPEIIFRWDESGQAVE